MYEHTTTELAEYLGVSVWKINYHIRRGFIKSTYKAKLNSNPKYYISHSEYIKFADWHMSYGRLRQSGLIRKRTPCIDEYDLEPNKYNSYVSLAIQRNKAILEYRYLTKLKHKDIAKEFNLSVRSIQSIVDKNKETDFAKELIKMRNVFR